MMTQLDVAALQGASVSNRHIGVNVLRFRASFTWEATDGDCTEAAQHRRIARSNFLFVSQPLSVVCGDLRIAASLCSCLPMSCLRLSDTGSLPSECARYRSFWNDRRAFELCGNGYISSRHGGRGIAGSSGAARQRDGFLFQSEKANCGRDRPFAQGRYPRGIVESFVNRAGNFEGNRVVVGGSRKGSGGQKRQRGNVAKL